jgi:hypothetical protein
MAEKRPSNSEQRLLKLEEEEAQRDVQPGILELFEPDEDAPLSRDDDGESGIHPTR